MSAEIWHSRSAGEALAGVGSSAAGLSGHEAAVRLAAHGPNTLVEGRRIGALRVFLGQFNSLLVWILIAAAIMSGALGALVDAIAILAIVALNACIGFYQEYQAAQSIAALRKMTAPQATVRRDGKIGLIPASGVVPGDVLVMQAGDLVAADARILAAASLSCVESALTGESSTVAKQPETLGDDDTALGDRTNMLFMGTSIATGTGEAVVVGTGMDTELGRIAGLIEQGSHEMATPLQQRLSAFGRVLVWATLGIVALLCALGWWRGTPSLELLMTAVSLAVAAVPEGLPAVVTVALAAGVRRMSRRHALVRTLAAVETLGSTSIICTDKTGTLTVGEMTVRELYVAGQRYEVTGEGYGPDGEVRVEGRRAEGAHTAPLLAFATALLGSNNAHVVQDGAEWTVVGDPTEGALLAAAAKAGADRVRVDRTLIKAHAFPFDSDRKRSSTVRRMPAGTLRAFVTGAPGPLLERCAWLYSATGVQPMTDTEREHRLAHASSMATHALRVLASAYRDLPERFSLALGADVVERELVFIGLSGMHDPPRPEARAAIEESRAAGIRVVMITGDHPQTAIAVAREIGLASANETAIAGNELDTWSDDVLQRRAAESSVYARVTAAHKLRLVRALKAGGAVVAMTGDGVNDAPAIQGADIGIAMGIAGTEVTKQAADMIITDDNFATIVAAVEQGRGIYANIRKTLQYLLAGNVGELLLMTACVVLGQPTPLLPIHLLWINLVTDGLPALCLATDPIEPGVMQRPPRPRGERLTDRGFIRTMLFTGVLTAGVALVVFLAVLRTAPLEVARSYAFTALVFAELLRSLGARSEHQPVWRIPLFSNANLLLVVTLSLVIQMWSQHDTTLGRFLSVTTVPWTDGLWLLASGAIPFAVLELTKAVRAASHSRQVKFD